LAGVCGLDSSGSGQGPVASCCEFGDEPSGSVACGKCLTFTNFAFYMNPAIQ
jgi:hypothetical protein